ncbi:hypothetical protein [Pseudomonas sp. p1(2021b)]|uniref:hypothetical protein n=1 Tax=Pseudomonas sp. p1(2021b) TaxID=2874628 RepID=UPI003D2AD85F
MPTENRSNTEMVSVPRKLLEIIRSFHWTQQDSTDLARAKARAELIDLLAKPAEQHQGEYPPCDYCGVIPDYHPWHGSGLLHGVENRHIHACDQCRGLLPLHPGRHQGEPVAWVRFRNGEPDYDGDACMIMNVPGDTLGDGDSWEPVYTHPAPADPGEVERLRDALDECDGERWKLRTERNTLRAQLAELLSDARGCVQDLANNADCAANKRLYTRMLDEIDAAISASAEPGGSQHKLAMDAACGEIEILRAQLAALRELKLPEFLKLSDEMRAAGEHAEQRAREDQCYSVPVLKAVFFEAAVQQWLDDQEEALSASADPSAPVERDELHLHLGRMIGQAEYMLELAENSSETDEDGDGSFDECREHIEQARAALERKPHQHLELIHRLHRIGTHETSHVLNGSCPDEIEGRAARDNDCPACQALMDADELLAARSDKSTFVL